MSDNVDNLFPHPKIQVTDDGPPSDIEPVLTVEKKGKKVRKTRLSTKDLIHYQPGDSVPQSTDTYHARWINSDEQPYIRYFKVNTDWQPLDFGWITKPSLFMLRNESPQVLKHDPSEGEVEEYNSLTIELGVYVPGPTEEQLSQRTMMSPPLTEQEPVTICTISPRESVRLSPVDVSRLVVRGRSDGTRCLLNAYPQ